MSENPSLLESLVGLLVLLAAVLALFLSLIFRAPKQKTAVEVLYANPIDRLNKPARPEPVQASVPEASGAASVVPVPDVPSKPEIRGPAKPSSRKYPRGSAQGSILLGSRKGPRVHAKKGKA